MFRVDEKIETVRKDEDEPTLGRACCYLEKWLEGSSSNGIQTRTWNRVKMRHLNRPHYVWKEHQAHYNHTQTYKLQTQGKDVLVGVAEHLLSTLAGLATAVVACLTEAEANEVCSDFYLVCTKHALSTQKLTNVLQRIYKLITGSKHSVCAGPSTVETMFGGDEVSAIVLDIGSNSARAGYAGEDTPKCVVQTAVGSISGDNTVGNGTKALDEGLDQEVKKDSNFRRYYVGSNALSFRRDGIEIFQPITEGLVNNWEQMEQLWNHLLRDRLRIDPSEHPILVSEPSYNTKANREKTTELMFEKYSTPALFVAKDAVLA
ncbi:actin-like protein 6A [Planoprotostelium fungivorum]|uniref:Actin-like protein 6A n=1 Tax=Planoprotostelium fungivorum TaxID=1890364 RepID=A0A2P6N3F9_9EUKA|nr:actin-like protein 6A [Planoprotostelium fungivorum]